MTLSVIGAGFGRTGTESMKRALETFFHGDLESAVTTLLEVSKQPLPDKDRERLRRMIDAARREGR